MKEMYEYKKRISRQDIIDVVDVAIPGMDYWCDEIRYNDKYNSAGEALVHGRVVGIHDAEENKWHNLSVKKLLKGLELTDNLEFYEYDMYASERVIQRALFGKEVYA